MEREIAVLGAGSRKGEAAGPYVRSLLSLARVPGSRVGSNR